MNGDFGQFIRNLRLEKNISQRELAHLSGLNHSEISRIEGGSRPSPSPDSLAKLAPYLGVAHEDLMRRLGYLSGAPRAGLDDAVHRVLGENDAVRALVTQLNGHPLSEAGKNYLENLLKTASQELDRLEQTNG